MSTLKKLHIRGIRSFDPQEGKSQVLEFLTPITLIVGENGCGKTTIIEALKYAITNAYPPGTDSGRSFVNDPKLSSGYEVLAQVKLEVADIHGNLVQCTRRAKLTQQGKTKAGKFQSLEGTLRTKGKDGNHKDWNPKCIDMKMEMCRYMGVSEAILNNVIFCHQEDSCWPLDEGKKVKERFDAIFNTTGYITSLKCLEIKDKDLGAKLKTEGEALKYAEKNLEVFKSKQKELSELEIQLATYLDSQSKLEKEQSEVLEKLKAIEEIERKLGQYQSVVSVCKERVSSGEKQVAELKNSVKEEFAGDMDELKSIIQDFKKTGDRKLKEIENLTGEVSRNEKELQSARKQEQSYLVHEGKFQQAEGLNAERVASMKKSASQILSSVKKLKEASQDLHNSSIAAGSIDVFIEAFERDSESIQPDVIIKALSSAVRAKESEFNKTKSVLEDEERVLQDAITELRTKKASVEKEVELKKQEVVKNKIAAGDLRKRLKSLEGSNDALALLDDDEATLVQNIEQLQKSGVIAKCEKEVQKLNEEIKDMEKSSESVSKQADLLSKDKTKTDQISMLSRQKIQKQNDCNETMRKIEDQLTMVLGSIPNENLEATLDAKIKELKNQVGLKQKELKGKEQENFKFDGEYRQVKKELEKLENEMEQWKFLVAEIQDEIEGGDFHKAYEELESQLDDKQKTSYYNEAAQFLYKKYIQQASKKPCCPLCKRNFSGDNEVQKLKRDLETMISKMKEKLPEVEREIEQLKGKHQSFAEVKPNWDQKAKLESETIPALKEQKKVLQGKISAGEKSLEEIDESLQMLNGDLGLAQNLTRDVARYEQSRAEVKKFDDSIRKIEKERDPAAKASTVTLQDVQLELETLQGSISTKRLEKDQKDQLRSRKRDELAELQAEKNRVHADKLRITSELQNREALEVQKKELEEGNKSAEEIIGTLNLKMPGIKDEISAAEKAKAKFLEEKDAQLQQIRSEKDAFHTQLNQLNELRKRIEEFEQSKPRYEEIKKKIRACKSQIEGLESSTLNTRNKLDELKNDVAAHQIKERELSDNLKLKTKLEELVALKRELSEKEKQMKDAMQSGGVGNQKRELSKKYERANAKLNESKGRCSELQKSIQGLQREIKVTYKTAESDFQDRLIKKIVYERAQVDIRKFKKALDLAIMTFHEKRMESINRSLKRYWQQIYQGNDIDMIQIRTQDEDAKGDKKIDLKSTRKSYSYRVVQIRRGIELDLRGRCSAGQKVLASIIIRIALAEAFSSKCGIITLDEPTTNLDDRNIRSLASCLSMLAQRMSNNKTFQLVVITHDQVFMERLLEVDQIDQYYRVKRDPNGFSMIVQCHK